MDPQLGPYATPRTWDKLQKVVNFLGGENATIDDITPHAISCVGNEAAIAFRSWFEQRIEIRPEDIVENLQKIKKELKGLRFDGRYEIVDSLVDYVLGKPEEHYLDKPNDTADIKKAKDNRGNNIREFLYSALEPDKKDQLIGRDQAVGIMKKLKSSNRADVMTVLKKDTTKFLELISKKMSDEDKGELKP
jgi:hypothetical protein